MRRLSARTLIILPWATITLASLFLFLSAAPSVTDQLITVAVIVVLISLPTAHFVAAAIVRGLHDLRAESHRLARLRSSPVDPYDIEELHTLRTAIISATDDLHARVDVAELGGRRLRALLESLTEGVLQLSSEGRIVTANAAARVLLHLPHNAEGQAISAVIRNAEVRRALQDAVTETSMEAREIAFSERQLLFSPHRLQFSAGGTERGVIIGIVDLTPLRKLETVRREFVANVSHEFKTPLTSIRGYAETMLNDELSREQQQQFIAVIRNNAERLQRIVDDLLDLSRLQSGGWQPVLQTVDVQALTEDVWSGLTAAHEKEIAFNVKAAGAPAVIADEGGLRQVITNVMENAVRYTPHQGRISVQIKHGVGLNGSPTPHRDMVEISIRDNGSGIPRDALPRIFERFYRADPARSRADGGTGLGLSIVKHLVESMDGEVSAQSELGKGTTIRLLLPAAGA
jgi:two-component system phosphate regulon sensor histidine kinase PhoR